MVGRRRLTRGLAGGAALAMLLAGSVGAKDSPRGLLPDLRSRAQTHLTFFSIGIFGGVTVNGCFPDEIAEEGARRCLRFDQSIANLGEGPFELRYEPPDYLTDPFMYQRIYRSDGSFEDRKAEQYEFHPTHAHFHYRGFAQSRLWRTDSTGARVGSAPVRTGRKNGFCVMDIEKVRPGAPTRRYDGSGCTATAEWLNGITEGWADTYTADLPDQYIEVSGVPDGVYQLETLADPDATVVEASETNNSTAIFIRIKGNTVEHLGRVPEPSPSPSPTPSPTPTSPPTRPPDPGPTPTPSSGGHSQSGGSAPKTTTKRRSSRRRRSCKPTRKRASAKRSATTSAKKKRRCQKRRTRGPRR